MVGPGGVDALSSGRLVEFYRIDLNPVTSIVQHYRRLLSSAERDRADRYVTADMTRRFVVCRGVLRQLLGAALGMPAEEIRFQTGPHGKPALATGLSSPLEFNVSHTADLAVIALSSQRIVGTDVEAVDRKTNRDELAARFFSPRERHAYFELPEAQRLTAFYRIWTCKEAYLKAIGAGLSFPLGKFSVSVSPNEPPGLIDVEPEPDELGRWSFVIPKAGPHYAAALAVEGHGWMLVCRDWNHGEVTGINCDRK